MNVGFPHQAACINACWGYFVDARCRQLDCAQAEEQGASNRYPEATCQYWACTRISGSRSASVLQTFRMVLVLRRRRVCVGSLPVRHYTVTGDAEDGNAGARGSRIISVDSGIPKPSTRFSGCLRPWCLFRSDTNFCLERNNIKV